MGRRGLIGVTVAAFLVVAGTAGGAAPRLRPATYTYDVRVSGTVQTSGTDAGTPNGDGPVNIVMTYELTFPGVAVKITPGAMKTNRTVVTATKDGTTSGKFTFTSRVSKNTCSGTFQFKNQRATLKVTARGERAGAPRFEVRGWIAPRGADFIEAQIQTTEGKCPAARPGRAVPPSTPALLGAGLEAFIGDPGVVVRRDTWTVKSRPLAQLLAGEGFTLDTGVRRQAVPDLCEPGSCVRSNSGRVRVEFRRAR
jgi:hypothetical protein